MDALIARLRASPRILWLMHAGADPDCVGSTFALREAFGGTAGAPEGMNQPGERLARELGLPVERIVHPRHHDCVVAVDTGSRAALGAGATEATEILLVDHHRYGDLHAAAPAAAWDPVRASCAEVVLALLARARTEPSARAAHGLLVGLVTDTARFRHADPAALRTAAELAERANVRLEDVYAWLEEEDEDAGNVDLRTATLKAAQRAEVTTVGAFLLATSHVGSFDAAAANALVRAGADLAVVGQERGDAARLSMRASTRLRAIHLGELANAVGRSIGWSAGGHEGAAGMRGAPPLARAQQAVMEEARRRIDLF